MNFKEKTLIVLALSIILLASVSAASAVDYSLTNAVVDLDVASNGLLNVNEIISYHFDSSPNGVYRDIPLKKGQTLENLEVYVDGAYAEYQLIDQGSTQRVKVYLYTDSTKKHKLSSGSDIDLILNYDITHAVKIYNDVGEIQYKVWGDEWEEDLNHIQATVHFPQKKELQYWINPYNNNVEATWSGDTLEITGGPVYDGKYVEARAIIPLSEFTSDAPYAQHIDKNGKDEIIKVQNSDKSYNDFFNGILSIVDGIAALLCALPALIYLKFGREPKTDYQAIYEHEPPTDDPPAYVNAMIGSFTKSVGKVNEEGFQATIMDLINRGKLGVKSEQDTDFTKTTILTVKSTEGLEPFERQVINILKRYELNGEISLSYMQDSLKGESEARAFKDKYDTWCENFESEYLSEDKFSRFFDSTGSDYLDSFGVCAIGIAVLLFVVAFFIDVLNSGLTMIMAFILAAVGVVSLMLPSGIAGKYTDEGKLYEEKWMKFKKFLEDYSLIKEHPPESIAIWNKYLVYATALGVADEVYDAMKMEVYGGDSSRFTTNDLFMFYYLGGNNFISDSFSTASSTISAADNSSVGGIGGGSGGGGGGAF
ncbi:MAG: DUF2207 domain-containing protein [Methanobrevibacter sp.]|nr:DUF2207 domain-containing protein [Methanobrevibacter sp.]